jgi:hypothetical protein
VFGDLVYSELTEDEIDIVDEVITIEILGY